MSYSFEQFLNFRSAYGATFRHDGERMAFLTDITGTAQVWTLDRPQGWPEQVTFYEDRVIFAEYSPTESVIAFGQDAGGDENQLIYLVADDGGVPTRLSVVEAKHLWGGWSPDGTRVAWSHNGRNGRDFDVYVYDLSTGQESMIVEGDGYWYVARWLPDGNSLVVGCATSNADNDLYLVGVDGKRRVHLTPHDGPVFFSSPCMARGSNILHLVTNSDGEFFNLAEIDLSTREREVPEPDARWDVEQIELSEDGRWFIEVRNEAGYSATTVHDRKSNTSRVIEELPRGVVGSISFVRGTSRVAMTVSGTSDTTDVWVLDLYSGEAERWTRSATAGIPRSALSEPELVEYQSFDGLRVSGFYWKPDGPAPFPVVIDIHGGPEAQRRPTLSAVTQYLVQSGFAVFAPNVRGSRGYGKTFMALDDVRKRMHSVADIKAAWEWLTSEGGGARDKIAVKGGSYGGFMVLSAMVTYPDLWAAGVDIVGVANFVTFLENTSEYRRHLREAEYGTLADDREFLHDISPLTHIHKIQAPLMVIHGRNDPRVPVSEAEQVVDACREKGLPVESIIYDDEGHGLAKRRNRLDAYPRIVSFLEAHVGR